jgi:hypothetical protein
MVGVAESADHPSICSSDRLAGVNRNVTKVVDEKADGKGKERNASAFRGSSESLTASAPGGGEIRRCESGDKATRWGWD